MENYLFTYFIKVSVAILLFYGLYMLCLRNDTFHKVKRFYLLSIVIVSLIYPFCDFNFSLNLNDNIFNVYEALLPEVIVSEDKTYGDYSSAVSINNVYTIVFSIIICGAIGLSIKLIFQLWKIFKLISVHKINQLGNYRLIDLDDPIAPFSFFRSIFIPKSITSEEDRQAIITHERVHVDQYHSFDIIIYEMLSTILWWNPIIWMLKKEVKINLEYLADEGTLKKGFEPKRYQYLLLEITNCNTGIYIASNFNVSQLKKRIIMINKRKSRMSSIYKYLFIVPVSMFMLSLNASNFTDGNVSEIESVGVDYPVMDQLVTEKKGEPYKTVQVMPEFPGGVSGLMKYISENLKYPETAVKNQTEGRVVIQFVVSDKGNVTDVATIQSVSPECDAEAVRVVESMPTWTPGKQDGKDVSVYYTLPIQYKLRDEDRKK